MRGLQLRLALGAGVAMGDLLGGSGYLFGGVDSPVLPQPSPVSSPAYAVYLVAMLVIPLVFVIATRLAARSLLALATKRDVNAFIVLGALVAAALFSTWLPRTVGARMNPLFIMEFDPGLAVRSLLTDAFTHAPVTTLVGIALAVGVPLIGLSHRKAG